DWAADMSELSTHYFDEGEPSEGDEVIFPEGYDALIDHLATDLDIRLNEIVTHVDYSGAAGVTIAASSGTFKADRVIVTLPIGVLKAGTVTFEPALPTPKQAAIETLGAGVLNKVYLQFADAFWQRQTHWISYISEPKGEFTTWFNLYQYTGEPILVAFNAGDFGRKIEAFTDDQIVDQAMQTLRRLYGETIPNPTDVQITRWLRDPFARCSYSFPTVGMTDETRADLAAPIDNRVFFAGEATHSGYPATVHGAYLSGQRAAKQLQQIGSTIAT
ncbi:MAG: FAD-dependent oxidoreductase, partial [Cyanobacteria bacterium P01_H01_bin.58]